MNLFFFQMKHESFPGVLNSPWKAEVFSGELRGVFMLDFTLWDEGSEIAWHCTRAVCTEAATLATVEVSSTLYIPFKKKDSAGSTSDEGFPKMCGC
jgi:hypothetical protein